MTKAKSKPCICCKHYLGGIPCTMNHKPRWYVDGGLRRVCNDFVVSDPEPVKAHWLDGFMRIFGFRRA